jgi:L-alanine-DL-glutamate epimerase-like enolase superfamily enzyme
MEIRARPVTLPFAETFRNSRGSRREEAVVLVELTHDGLVGHGEGAPVTYRGETQETMLEFIEAEVAPMLEGDPHRVEEIAERLRSSPGNTGAKCAVEAALHDWIGKRHGEPLWRLLGLAPTAPPTSYTVSIDTLEGTLDRVRRAGEFKILKVKVGDPNDVERLEAIRRTTEATIRVDANEGWDTDTAVELMATLVRLDVEFLEQPLPVADVDGYRILCELRPRVPIVLDESCQDLASVAPVARLADGVSVKLEKAGGLREAMRVIHAARALDLKLMLSCMLQSQLGIAHAVQLASLVDWADLDGHFLIADSPYTGLRFENGQVLPSRRPGLGVIPVGAAA